MLWSCLGSVKSLVFEIWATPMHLHYSNLPPYLFELLNDTDTCFPDITFRIRYRHSRVRLRHISCRPGQSVWIQESRRRLSRRYPQPVISTREPHPGETRDKQAAMRAGRVLRSLTGSR